MAEAPLPSHFPFDRLTTAWLLQVEGLRKELGDERKKGQSPYGQPYPSPRPVNDSGVLTQSSILERTIGSVPDNSRTGNSFTFSGTGLYCLSGPPALL